MRCEEIHNEIFALIDGELSSERSDEIREHIGSCSDCSKYESFVSGVFGEIELEKSEKVSADFDSRVIAGISNKSVGSASVLRRVLTPLATAAIVLFGIFTGIGLGEYSSAGVADDVADLPSEYYYANEIHLETIEGFFLTNGEGEGDEKK